MLRFLLLYQWRDNCIFTSEPGNYLGAINVAQDEDFIVEAVQELMRAQTDADIRDELFMSQTQVA